MSINRVNISGNLTRDPEVRQTQGGTAVMRLGVAVNDRRKNPQTGQWEDTPNYIDCCLFGNRATALQQHLAKGMKVAIEGKLRWSQWQDKSGQKRSKIEVIIDEIEFMPQQQHGGYQQRPQMAPQAHQMPQNGPQAPQGYANAQQKQMAPQMASQPQYGGYQPQTQPPQAQQIAYEDEDIPF